MINDCNRYGSVTSKCIFQRILHVKRLQGHFSKKLQFYFLVVLREKDVVGRGG